MAGALAGSVMAFANCPIELLKVRLQVQDPSRVKLYKNIFECAQMTFASYGLRGLYRGFTATIIRDIPSFASYFFVYEYLRSSLRSPNGDLKTTDLLLAGGIAGFGIKCITSPLIIIVGAWIPCYPQDVIKSRMQASSAYKNSFDCAMNIYREGGLRAFFRGFGPTMARAFPANAATFFAYELVRSHLQ